MPKNIIFEKDKVICETEKLNKSGMTVTRDKTMITAGIARATELVMMNKDGSACPKREIELVFQRENGEYHTAYMDISELTDGTKFMNAINHLDIVVSATRDEMGCFRRSLLKYSKFSSCAQQWYSGIFEEGGRLIYVDRNGFIAAGDKKWNKSMAAAPSAPHRDLAGISDVSKETIEETIAKLHEYGPLSRCAAVIGFAQAAALNWHLNKLGYELPVLYLTGETGAGKTATLKKILQPLTGCEGEKPIMADSLTTFSLSEVASRSNIMPLVIDEVKTSTFSKRSKNCLSNSIRNVHTGTRMLRGTKDLNVNEYVMLRPLVLAGETELEEPALRNRTATCGFYGNDITPERRVSFDWLASRTDALRAISWKMLRHSLSLTTEDVQEAIDNAMTYVPDTFRQERVRKSFAIILAGYMLFAKEFYTKADISSTASALANSIFEHVMGSSAVPETEAIQFLRTLGDMTEADSEASYYLAHERYYRYDAEEDAIWLNLNNVYPLYREYCRRNGIDAAARGALKKQLKHHPEIMSAEGKPVHVPGGKTERRNMFRLKALPADTAEKFRLSNQTGQAVQHEQPEQTQKPEQAMQPEQSSQMSLYKEDLPFAS